MRRVARTLEASLAAHSPSASDEQRQQRRAEIAKMPGRAEQIIARQLDRLAANHNSAATLALDSMSRAFGVRYLGNGAIASVYIDGTDVVKVHRSTARMSESDRRAYLEQRQIAAKALQSTLGPMVATQTLGIETHPLGGYQVVTARQPFIRGSLLDLFETNTANLNTADVADYCDRQPDGHTSLTALAERTFISDENSGVVPDLNGADNFRLVGRSEDLVLIDADPVCSSQHPWLRELILKQAETLGRFVGAQ